MNIDNNILQSDFKPTALMVCYEGDSLHYIELHQVSGLDKKGGLKIKPGIPLTKKALRALLSYTEKGKEKTFSTISNLLPENVNKRVDIITYGPKQSNAAQA